MLLPQGLASLVLAASPPAPAADAEAASTVTSLLEFIQAGGVIGYVIILLSFVALALAVVHLFQIRESALAPQHIVDELHDLLRKGRIDEAARFCEADENRCFLTHVMDAGLSRYRRSAFGALELKGALEEAGQEQIQRLYRSTDALSLVAAIAPMLGLLGTVVGINGAFATISTTEGFTRPDQLAGDISLALVTTIMGLTLAIPATAAVTFFRNRIDALASELAAIIDDLAAHLEEAPSAPATPAPAAARPRPNVPQPVPSARPAAPVTAARPETPGGGGAR